MQLRSNAGFTLIEMLVVIAIISSAGIALTGMIQYFYKSNAFLLEQTAALDNARRGLGDAVGALREASYGDDGSYLVAQAATSSITFYSDFDRDASVEKEQYVLKNSILYRVVTESTGSPPTYTGQISTTTIAAYVRNTSSSPLFTYYDASGSALSATSTNLSAISSIGITLLVDLNPNRAPNVFTLSETATLRNVRPQ